jgi:hypothetical protein
LNDKVAGTITPTNNPETFRTHRSVDCGASAPLRNSEIFSYLTKPRAKFKDEPIPTMLATSQLGCRTPEYVDMYEDLRSRLWLVPVTATSPPTAVPRRDP